MTTKFLTILLTSLIAILLADNKFPNLEIKGKKSQVASLKGGFNEDNDIFNEKSIAPNPNFHLGKDRELFHISVLF